MPRSEKRRLTLLMLCSPAYPLYRLSWKVLSVKRFESFKFGIRLTGLWASG